MSKCYVICGPTWPYLPSLWTSKRGANRAAAEMRRKIREAFPDACKYSARNLHITVEHRNLRDMSAHYSMQANNLGEYPRRKP